MIQEHYSNHENCYRDLAIARKGFTNPETTKEQLEAIEKTLGLMYLYCPEDIMFMVQATMEEMNMRKLYRGIV